MERVPQVEQSITPEKSRDELYFETLKAKRNVLSSHYALGQLRKNIDRRIEEISDDKFKEDPEVQQYEAVKKEYDRHRELFLASLENLNEGDSQKISELTSLTKVEVALSSLEKPAETGGVVVEEKSAPRGEPQIENPSLDMTAEEIDQKIAFAKRQTLGLKGESVEYWETKKAQFLERQKAEANPNGSASKGFMQGVRDSYDKTKEAIMGANRISGGSETVESRMSPLGLRKEAISKTENMAMSEVDRMIRYSIDTARPLELAYWESKRRELKYENRVVVDQDLSQISPQQEQKPKQEKIEEKTSETLESRISKPIEKLVEKPVPVEMVKTIETPRSAVERVISIDQKDAIDSFIKKGEGSVEAIMDLAKKENIDEKAIDKVVDEVLGGIEASLGHEKIVPQEKTFFKKIRDSLKNKVVIYVGVGLMALMAWNSETREHFLKTPTSVVKVLDKIPDIRIATDFPQMVASEAARYKVMPYLVARYIGSNNYFDLEAIKIANTVGLEGAANNMYERSLSDYINNFSETRQANRFTTLDKHTVRGYIDTFTQIYTGHEQSDSGVKTYQKLKGFLQKNFGAAKVYELALKVSSEKELSPKLLAFAESDLLKQEIILGNAIGKSGIYFNQEEGVFNVIHDGKLIDTYASRAGFMNVPKGEGLKSLGYERTPDGKFTISSIEYGYSTLRWRDSFLPYGAEIRIGKSNEIEYQYRGKWYPATGSEATYFDQGHKIKPNKSEKDLKYLAGRSKGESPLTKYDFYSVDGLMTHWNKNPFGPISYRLAGRGELIHSNPTDSDNILHPSHGCIRLDKEDIKTLESYIGTGVSKITISSKDGETWSPKS